MTRHSDSVRLRDMLDHAVEAVNAARSRSRKDLDTDRIFNLAVVRLVEIVGEAAAHVSQDTRDRCPGIPWGSVVGLRNRLIHGYDEVDFDILWDIVRIDFPNLIAELRSLSGQGPGQSVD